MVKRARTAPPPARVLAAEDRADAEAFLAHEREPGEWKQWAELRDKIAAHRERKGASRARPL
jgi:hypothetical protein